MGFHHLAQVNIARMRAPLDAPLMEGFTSRIPEINALAEASPGFVWRLQDESGDATDVRPFDDETILFNASVWESVEALRQYAYKSRHVELFRDRTRWFLPFDGVHAALWWVPAGHTPSAREATERLAYLEEAGPGPFAFGFKAMAKRPAEPDRAASDDRGDVDLDGRRFRAVENAPGGDVGEKTVFWYGQQGGRVWSTYEGGGVRFGSLVAAITVEGRLDARYQHLGNGKLRAGKCSTQIERLDDGRLRLRESWVWTQGVTGSGVSVLEEVS